MMPMFFIEARYPINRIQLIPHNCIYLYIIPWKPIDAKMESNISNHTTLVLSSAT